MAQNMLASLTVIEIQIKITMEVFLAPTSLAKNQRELSSLLLAGVWGIKSAFKCCWLE